MARVIALDSGVLVALFDAHDAHHAAAEELFTTHVSEPMTIGPITLAEVWRGFAPPPGRGCLTVASC